LLSYFNNIGKEVAGVGDVVINGDQPTKNKKLGGCTGKGFMPGQSGNPGGRPKEVGHVRALAKKYTEEAIRTLAELMRTGKPDRARVAAAEALLDRAYGKPTQPLAGDESLPALKIILDGKEIT
jgi:hypothetical protein